MALRPGPLRELPLERFIDVPFRPVPATPRQAHKRPLSPGTPNLFSPTKRRILAQEGVFSPEKTIKSSIAPSYRALVIRDQGPARKLDFGQSPRRDSKAMSSSRFLEDSLMEPTPECSRMSRRHDHNHPSLPIPSAPSSQLLSIQSLSSNPQMDIRYPDFDVRVDCDLAPSFLSNHSSFSDSRVSDEDKENSHDDKENVRPKAKLRSGLLKRLKAASLVSPEQLRRPNAPKVPFTPLNARSPPKARLPRELTPGKTVGVHKDEMRRRREFLAMELDGDDDSDDGF